MRIATLALLPAVLAGCSGPLTMDNAIGTLPVANPSTDCQIRISNANIEGGGVGVQGSGGTRIVTIVGANNCTQEMLDEALGIRRVPVTPNNIEPRLRALEAVISPVQ